MAENLTPARVAELVRMAKSMTSDEINVLVTAFGLNIAQDFNCEMIAEDPEEFEGQSVIAGMDMIESAVMYVDDWFGDHDLQAVNKKYAVGQYFDITLERKLVAKPRKV